MFYNIEKCFNLDELAGKVTGNMAFNHVKGFLCCYLKLVFHFVSQCCGLH